MFSHVPLTRRELIGEIQHSARGERRRLALLLVQGLVWRREKVEAEVGEGKDIARGDGGRA